MKLYYNSFEFNSLDTQYDINSITNTAISNQMGC